jgi:hypothetical protein
MTTVAKVLGEDGARVAFAVHDGMLEIEIEGEEILGCMDEREATVLRNWLSQMLDEGEFE